MTDTLETGVHGSGVWTLYPNYDITSRQTSCSVTNTIKRPTDLGIFRPALPGAYVEEEGFYDISQLAIEEAAHMIGWRSPEEVEAALSESRVRERNANLTSAKHARTRARLEAEVEELKAQLAELEAKPAKAKR